MKLTLADEIKDPKLFQQNLELIYNFTDAYRESINLILIVLLERTFHKIRSDKDRQIIYMKIISLLNQITSQFSSNMQASELDGSIFRLKNVKIPTLPEGLRMGGLNASLTKDIIETIDKFMKELLADQYEDAEPHEKSR